VREDTIPHLLWRNVERYGKRVALRQKDFGVWQEISWEEFGLHVRHFCLGLISLGLKRGEHVSIFGENNPEWLYADLATQSAGAVAVGVYPTNPPKEAKYVIGHSQSVFVVCDDQEQVDKVLEVKADLPTLRKIIVIDMKGLRRYRDPLILSFEEVERLGRELDQKDPELYGRLLRDLQPEDVALMVYTSGTTGPPKGAMISHTNVLNMLQALIQVLPQDEDDETVSYLPLCHVAERMMSVFVPLYVGSTVNFAESLETVQLAMREILPTIFLGVPRIWEKMLSGVIIRMKDASWLKRKIFEGFFRVGQQVTRLNLDKKPVPLGLRLLHGLGDLFLYRALKLELGLLRARVILSGAAPISPEVLRYFHSVGIPVLEGYGMTEQTGVACVNWPDNVRLGSVGKPLPGVEIQLAEDGEILIRCPHNFVGYYRDPEATARILEGGWLHTGDVGEWDSAGSLKITDRKKEIIITSGGKNIAPSEIENRLKVSPYITQAIVIGDRRKYLTALIQIDYENAGKWAQERNIPYTTFKSLAQNPQIYELIRREVEEANKDFSSVETVKKFTLLDKELDHDDDELTATLKVRRKAIHERFGPLIEAMYKG
jgi:long-chain acyl-CoA synthetase